MPGAADRATGDRSTLVIAGIAIALLTAGGACGIVRLALGPTLADRVVALDVVLVAAMGAIAVHAASGGSTSYLAILAVIAIVAFTVTVVASRHIETSPEGDPARGDRRREPAATTGHRSRVRRGRRR